MPLTKFLKYHGESATIINFTEDSTDDYGDKSFTESTEDTKVVEDVNSAMKRQNAYQQAVDVDAFIYADNEVDVYDGNGGNQPSEIELSNPTRKYEVQLIETENTGIDRLVCQRI